jgi:ABC-type sugar transport system ATPase subunit
VFLFDEPLSSLDAQLRQELREELARLHRLTRTTSIYVTHDQKEALSLGDRVAVFDRGEVRQVGTPESIYRDPHDLFVARFVGDPAINVIEGEIVAENGRARFRAPGFSLALASIAGHAGQALLGVRPEGATLGTVADSTARASVDRVERLGGETLIHLSTEAGPHVLRAEPRGALPSPGDVVGLLVDARRALFFDPQGKRIRLD